MDFAQYGMYSETAAMAPATMGPFKASQGNMLSSEKLLCTAKEPATERAVQTSKTTRGKSESLVRICEV